jgi:sulfur-carrier protein
MGHRLPARLEWEPAGKGMAMADPSPRRGQPRASARRTRAACRRRLSCVPGSQHTSKELEAMAHVVLMGNLRQYTGGVSELEVDAANVRQLFQRLGAKFPELARHLEDGLAVAIDGQIYQDSLLEPIGADSDVHILPQIAGG